MRIVVRRFVHDIDTSLSVITVDGGFSCFGLEDEPREEKVVGETRIPAGRYRVDLRTEGGMNDRYGRRFDFHRGMLWLRDVPEFSYIYFHCGNYEHQTDGCILVGVGAIAKQGDMMVTSSVEAYERFYQRVVGDASRGTLVVDVIDDD